MSWRTFPRFAQFCAERKVCIQTMDSLEQYAAGVNELAALALRAVAPAHEYFEQALAWQDSLALELLRIR